MTGAKVDMAVHWITVSELMTALSEARHQLQSATNVLKKEFDITLDPNSTTGQYAFPADYKESVSARYQANANLAFVPVNRVSYDWYMNRIYADSLAPPTTVGSGFYAQNGATLYLAEAYDQFLVYPYAGATGTVKVRYMPICTPYSPGDSTVWSGYGPDPTAAMKANGPEREFQNVLMAIKDFCLAAILEKKPLGTKYDALQAASALERFEKGIESLRRTNVDYSNLTPQTLYMGPVQ